MTARYARPAPYTMEKREWPSKDFTEGPIWCAVDLRDGNQALPDPMTPKQKRGYFQLLANIGFKQVEIGFPAASKEDFQFCRDLIEEDLIPEDVTISVLTAAREDLIQRTVEALKGVKKALVHMYIATSELHTHFVFDKSLEEIRDLASEQVQNLASEIEKNLDGDIGLQFSPEEFTDGDIDFNVDLCDRVVETWGATPDNKIILNLPATVERRPPHQYADMIEEFGRRQKHRDASCISVHAHNDMGCAVAASELTLLAGADRVEGTLFGQGERSGNVDLVTLALNLQYMGIDTGLDFTNIEKIRDEFAELTSMPVHARQPYAGELVFTAFAGSHQDAIHKGLNQKEETRKYFGGWKIPYLHIDPADIGRSFERFIRINSQSGKGGIAYVLQSDYGLRLPRELLKDFSPHVQATAEQSSHELDSTQIWNLFKERYLQLEEPIEFQNYWPHPKEEDPTEIEGEVHVRYQGEEYKLHGSGSGPIAAFVRALRRLPIQEFTLEGYEEDALSTTADAEAVCFVPLQDEQKTTWFGIGFGSNIDQAAVRAIISGLNRLLSV